MRGGEYLRPDVLAQHWGQIGQALEAELSESRLLLNEFLKARDSRWRLVGRVHFNLAENRRDPECPFAFMATYTSGLAASGALRHLPLGQALREFAGVSDKAKLPQLLDPVSRASEACSWLKAVVDAGEIFHPLRWTPQEALRFLHDVGAMEQAGLVIGMPANWRMNRPSRPRVEATVGSTSPSVLGLDALLDFQVGVRNVELAVSAVGGGEGVLHLGVERIVRRLDQHGDTQGAGRPVLERAIELQFARPFDDAPLLIRIDAASTVQDAVDRGGGNARRPGDVLRCRLASHPRRLTGLVEEISSRLRFCDE